MFLFFDFGCCGQIISRVIFKIFPNEAASFYFRDFNAEPELMPKTPSQKKNSRRKRVSLGRQEENQARRRFVAFITVLIQANR